MPVLQRKKTIGIFLSFLITGMVAGLYLYFNDSDDSTTPRVSKVTKSSIPNKIQPDVKEETHTPPSPSTIRRPASNSRAAEFESFYRWVARSESLSEHRDEILKTLKNLPVKQAGKVALGDDESYGKYFHFYIPNENLAKLKTKIERLLGSSFNSEHVTAQDKKSNPGNTRVVFVLSKKSEITRKVAQENTEEEKERFIKPTFNQKLSKRHFEFKFSPSNSFLKATDNTNNTKANFASNVNLGLGASYVQHLSHQYHLGMDFKVTHMKFDAIDSRPLSGDDQVYLGHAITLDRHFEKFTLKSSLGMKDTPFIYSSAATKLNVEKLSVPYLTLGAKKTLAQFESGYRLDSEISPRLLFPVNDGKIRSRLGHGLMGKVSSVDELKNGNAYFLSLGIIWEKQNSNVVDQSYIEGFLELGMRWGDSN